MKSLYLFFGDEEYLIKSKLRSLKEKHKNASLETYDHNTTAEVLAETLRMSSLFAPERLIIVEDINLARSEWLLEVMPDLSPGTTLVLLPEQVDRRNKVFKYFSKHGEIFEARAYAPWQQEEAAEVILKEANISRPAARLLVEIVGTDLRSLMSEVEKISTYCGEGQAIDEAAVNLLAVSGEMDAFALVNSLRFKNAKTSLLILQRAFREKTDPFSMLGMLAQQFRMALLVKSFGGTNHFTIAQSIKSTPFYVKKCLEFAQHYKTEEIKNVLNDLHEVGLKLKTGANARVLMSLLVNDICNG